MPTHGPEGPSEAGDLLQRDLPLLERYRTGDPGAARTVFLEYGAAARNVLARIVRDAVEQQDLHQKTFMNLWLKREQYRGDGPYGAVVRRAALRCGFDYLRSRRRRPTEPLPDHVDVRDPDPSPEEAAEWHEWLALIEEFTRRGELSVEESRVFHLYYVEGLSHDGITRNTGLSPKAVKIRLGHVKRKFVEFLDQRSAPPAAAPERR